MKKRKINVKRKQEKIEIVDREAVLVTLKV
jgi:hypothetical protein